MKAYRSWRRRRPLLETSRLCHSQGLAEGHAGFAPSAADFLRGLRYARSYYFRVTLLAALKLNPNDERANRMLMQLAPGS